MGNPFVHVELATTDLDKAKSFYQSLFDWKLKFPRDAHRLVASIPEDTHVTFGARSLS